MSRDNDKLTTTFRMLLLFPNWTKTIGNSSGTRPRTNDVLNSINTFHPREMKFKIDFSKLNSQENGDDISTEKNFHLEEIRRVCWLISSVI